MAKSRYIVYGKVTATVTIEIEANSPEEAIYAADFEFSGVDSYLGNGGDNKLIGVAGENETIETDGDVIFEEAVETYVPSDV